MKRNLVILAFLLFVLSVLTGARFIGGGFFKKGTTSVITFENYQVSDGVGGWDDYQVDDGASGWEDYQVKQ